MPVGKGSIKRAAMTKTAEKAVSSDKMKAEEAKQVPGTVSEADKTQTAAKKPEPAAAVRSSVISSDDIHEKKFEAISRIHCDLPTWML